MNHAPVHTTGAPATPEDAERLAEFDALTTGLPGPLLVGAELADKLIERFGRLPANTEVYVIGAGPCPDMPSLADLLPAVLKRIRIDFERDAANAWQFRERGAQWKRERNGRPTNRRTP